MWNASAVSVNRNLTNEMATTVSTKTLLGRFIFSFPGNFQHVVVPHEEGIFSML